MIDFIPGRTWLPHSAVHIQSLLSSLYLQSKISLFVYFTSKRTVCI